MTNKRGKLKAADRTAGESFSRVFLEDLVAAARTRRDLFPNARKNTQVPGVRLCDLTIDTSEMEATAGGLPTNIREQLVVLIGDNPDLPPRVYVQHDRFAGFPHVLTDGELCIYLDPGREWDPQQGGAAFLNRVYDWFVDAKANRFDPATALYHPVGGRAHTSSTAPLVVCRDDPLPTGELGFAALHRISDHRSDLRPHQPDSSREQLVDTVLVVRAPGPLHAGPGATVSDVLANLGPGLMEKALHAWVLRMRRQIAGGSDFTHLVLLVPNPAGSVPYLMVGRVAHHALAAAVEDHAFGEIEVEWCPVDDQRASITTRRDSTRPVAALRDQTIAIVGCGGLGGWIAEFAARAGASTIHLMDPATVKGGLLVRQNLRDVDIGRSKDEALAERLHEVAPETAVVAGAEAWNDLSEVLAGQNAVVIDATVSLAFGRRLDAMLAAEGRRAMAVRVSTDVATGSMGMVTISAGASAPSLGRLDADAGAQVRLRGELEPYLTFWEPREGDELVPARGCSIPTFHGSAADLAAVAAEMLNLIAAHHSAQASGTRLFALPHSGIEPTMVFLRHSE